MSAGDGGTSVPDGGTNAGDGGMSVRDGRPGLPPRPTAKAETLASDADRDGAVQVLSEAFAEGRLTADEHDDRVRVAYAARTWRELAGLTADLPRSAGAGYGRAAPGMAEGLDWCLICALLICCPPAGIAWLLLRHRAQAGRSRASEAGSLYRPLPDSEGTSLALPDGRGLSVALPDTGGLSRAAAGPGGDGCRAEDR